MSTALASHFRVRDDGVVHLLGSVCETCGTTMFPKRLRCASCFGAQLRELELPRSGEVRTHTVVRQAPKGYHGPVPYSLGQVLLGGELLVLAHLIGKPATQWRAGDRVDTCAMSLEVRTDNCTSPMTCYAFTPSD